MSELYHKLKAAVADRYQLEIELGSGGMATVYLAVDRLHKRRVALKILHPRLAGAVGHDRFLQEIRFAAELTHPHILPLLDSGTVTIDDRTLPYYVMPFVEGESLRARLQRQKQLPIEEALSIARDVAAALSYAHAHKVVHRDIKPENILLAGHEAVVADFGIARAINRAAESEVITTEGMAVGTPAYMSPEQSLAVQEIDGRTDIYSLGCVMYEMLGGSPPFTGGTPQAIVARHQMDPVPSLTTIRPTVPIALELIIKKSLQKQPADRFQSADELVRALGTTASGGIPTVETRARSRRRFWTALMLLGVAASGTVAAILIDDDENGDPGEVLDTTLFAIIPTQQEAGAGEVDPSLLLQDALAGWRGVNLVDPFQVRAAINRDQGSGNWGKVARELKAGRYVRVDASRVGGSLRINAVLYDTKDDKQLVNHAERIASDYSDADSIFAQLAERILFRDNLPKTQLNPVVGTRIIPARQAFQRGYRALEDWNLTAADSAFDAATRYDPQFAQGFLWLALVRLWYGSPASQWRSAVERAAAGKNRLSPRDQRMTEAVLAQGDIRSQRPCQGWKRLTDEDPYSFVAWYGYGECLRGDEIVIRDAQSPSGFRFRSSYHHALAALRRSFEQLPSIHRALRGGSFEYVRRLFKTSENDLRSGVGLPPDTITFVAAPAWHDTLVFIPVPAQEVAKGRSIITPATSVAVREQRRLFHEIAMGWVVEFPQSAEAMEALAVSLELMGNRGALDTLRRARRLAQSPAERLNVAAAEVWLQVRFSAGTDLQGLLAAKRLADSLLQANASDPSRYPEVLIGLAALTGKTFLAARLSQEAPMIRFWSVPPSLTHTAPRLMVYAAMGGPADSLRIIEAELETTINREFPESERLEHRLRWIALPATLAFPNTRLGSIESLEGKGDWLLNGMAAYSRGEQESFLRTVQVVGARRKTVRPADLPLDALYPEAWLIAQLGDPEAAIRWLDPTLTSLTNTAPYAIADASRTGPLVRAMALRADLAQMTGDRVNAARWASAVVTLWSDSDEFLQPLVQRMKRLVN